MTTILERLPWELQSRVFEYVPLTFLVCFLPDQRYTDLVLQELPRNSLTVLYGPIHAENLPGIVDLPLIANEEHSIAQDTLSNAYNRHSIFFGSESYHVLMKYLFKTANLRDLKTLHMVISNLNTTNYFSDILTISQDTSKHPFNTIVLEILNKKLTIEFPFEKLEHMVTLIDAFSKDVDLNEPDSLFLQLLKNGNCHLSPTHCGFTVVQEEDTNNVLIDFQSISKLLYGPEDSLETQITSLDISRNRMGRSASVHNKYIFENFVNLQSLSLSIYTPWSIINDFHHLKKLELKKVDFEGHHMVDVPSVEYLTMINCFIQTFDAVSLQNLKSLTMENCSSFTRLLNISNEIKELNLRGNINFNWNEFFNDGKVYENLTTLAIGPVKQDLKISLNKSTPNVEILKVKFKTIPFDLFPHYIKSLDMEVSRTAKVELFSTKFHLLEHLILRNGFIESETFDISKSLKTLKLFDSKISNTLDFSHHIDYSLKEVWLDGCHSVKTHSNETSIKVSQSKPLSSLVIKKCTNISIHNLLKSHQNLHFFVYITDSNVKTGMKKNLNNFTSFFESHLNSQALQRPQSGTLRVDKSKHEMILSKNFGANLESSPEFYYITF